MISEVTLSQTDCYSPQRTKSINIHKMASRGKGVGMKKGTKGGGKEKDRESSKVCRDRDYRCT